MSMIGFILTSLKVVNMAVSFFTETNLRETVFLSEDIFSLRSFLEPATGVVACVSDFGSAFEDSEGEGADFFAAWASSLVIRPSLPVPETSEALIPFSERILAAAGEACPVA